MSLYRNILGQAWKITWQSKYLWFFGLFAALLGNGGVLEIIFHDFNSTAGQGLFPGWQRFAETGIFSFNTIPNIGRLMIEDPISLFFALLVLLIVLGLFVFLVWLVIVSQSALVHNSANIIAGKKHNFKNGLEIGMKKFWPVFGLNIIIKLIIYIVFILISLPIIFSMAQGYFTAVNLLFVISFLIFIPLSIVLSFIVKYAIAYVVIKGSRFIDAIQAGWKLFVKNWLVSLEVAFVLFFINFVVGLCLMLLFLILAVPFLFLALILFLVLIATVGAGLATFQISAWTGLFIELVSRGAMSKIARVFGKG